MTEAPRHRRGRNRKIYPHCGAAERKWAMLFSPANGGGKQENIPQLWGSRKDDEQCLISLV